MPRAQRPRVTPVGDTDPFRPSRERPVRVRARTMAADTHFEPHHHAWAQLAYSASGMLQVIAARSPDALDEVTYIVPPSRAVWIAPGARHAIHVLEAAEFRTLYMHASVTPSGWQGCRMIVVSPLLRELIAALDAHAPVHAARQAALAQLVLDEITHADTQPLGVPMPHPQDGDKRLRALCEAVLRSPAERATLSEWAGDMGTSYPQWRQQVVLAHALPLLARGTAVSLVAAASGYASDSAFTAMFKAAMGEPPSAFQGKQSA